MSIWCALAAAEDSNRLLIICYYVWLWGVCVCVCGMVCVWVCVWTEDVGVLVWMFFFIDNNSMPHYAVIHHALHNLKFSFKITFTFNNLITRVIINYVLDTKVFDV